MNVESDSPVHRSLAIQIAAQLEPDDRVVLRRYAEEMLVLRESELSVMGRALDALSRTADLDLLRVFTSTAAKSIVRIAWQDRTWAARLGLSAATVAAAATAGQSAGIAAFGTAIGVPLWIVLGAGGAFAGVLIDELTKVGATRRRVGRSEGELGADYYDAKSIEPNQILKELEEDLSGELELRRFDEELGLETIDPPTVAGGNEEEAGPDLGAVWNRLLLRLTSR